MKKQEVVLRDFTTIEQSKILSEFLPIETANMIYCYTKEGDKLISPIPIHLTSTPTNTFKYLYCWSLAALLNYLSANFRTSIKCLENQWELNCIVWVEYSKELIDACYNMLVKLHKQKFL